MSFGGWLLPSFCSLLLGSICSWLCWCLLLLGLVRILALAFSWVSLLTRWHHSSLHWRLSRHSWLHSWMRWLIKHLLLCIRIKWRWRELLELINSSRTWWHPLRWLELVLHSRTSSKLLTKLRRRIHTSWRWILSRYRSRWHKLLRRRKPGSTMHLLLPLNCSLNSFILV